MRLPAKHRVIFEANDLESCNHARFTEHVISCLDSENKPNKQRNKETKKQTTNK